MGLDAQIRSLRQPVRPLVVVKYLTRLGLIAGLLGLVPLAICLGLSEWALAGRWAVTILLLVLPGLGLALRRPPARNALATNEALVILALAYVLIGLVQSYPLLAPGLPWIDALFESVSALTTTGLSTLPGVQDLSPGYLFSRAWIQWYGGVGIAIISLAVLIRRSGAARRLLDASLEQEDLVGSSRAHSRRTIGVYLVLTGLAFLLLWPLLGAWEGLLYTLSGVSTGGFSPRDASLGEFAFAIQALIMLLACAGALPLVLYYRGLKTGWGALLRDLEVRGLLGLTLVFGILLGLALGAAGELPWGQAWRHGLVLTASAQSGTGYASMELSGLSAPAALVLILSMFIGGGLASTSGGIHVFRLLLLWRLLRLTMLRTCLPQHAVLDSNLELGGHRLSLDEALPALLTVLLFLGLILVSWALFLSQGYDPMASLFEVTSASATVGLTSGIAGPELPSGLKLLLCADMLLGRLEILAFLVLLCPGNWRS
jgi:trk system potassium uptake protein TrkH